MKVFKFSKNADISAAINFEHVIDKLNEMRDGDCNKGTFGTLCCVCGSYGMAGAAMLCGSAAVTTGAGLVKMVIPESIYPICASNLWENVFVPISQSTEGTLSKDQTGRILEEAGSSSAVVIGCGLKVTEDTKAICTELLKKCERPIILDADGLNCICSHIDILKERSAPTILTPHPGEMSRLCGCTVTEVQENRIKLAEEFAKNNNCVMVLKGSGTVITDGSQTYVNPTGNGCLAKGGSGDVLAGVIGALVCQGTEPLSAAAAGTYIHGFAADECTDEYAMSCVTARDVIAAIKHIM